MASAGVVGIIKHIPGHGRALVDSHKELPVVTASAEDLDMDLEPFGRIDACGYPGLASTRLADLGVRDSMESIQRKLSQHVTKCLIPI